MAVSRLHNKVYVPSQTSEYNSYHYRNQSLIPELKGGAQICQVRAYLDHF